MATLRASSAFDMRTILRDDAVFSAATNTATLVSGGWRTVLTGDFHVLPSGISGTLTGFSQSYAGRPVFEAVGVERYAPTVFEIVAERDNDRFLAYTLSGDDVLIGSSRHDYLIGFGGNDALRGGAGNDELFGGSGRDTIDGGPGSDFLAGGLDFDLMRGGTGSDTYLVAQAGDRVVEAADAGVDTILSTVTTTIAANVERLVLIGNAAIDGHGGAGNDDINGNEAANYLTGGAGADTLDGDGGADILEGGPGRDSLTGGSGNDIFRFRTIGAANGDSVADFASGHDKLAFGLIDADVSRPGDQAFHFIGPAPLSGHAGEITAHGTWLQGDIDGDGVADFTVRFGTTVQLHATDLIL